jgi:hypothetical protein
MLSNLRLQSSVVTSTATREQPVHGKLATSLLWSSTDLRQSFGINYVQLSLLVPLESLEEPRQRSLKKPVRSNSCAGALSAGAKATQHEQQMRTIIQTLKLPLNFKALQVRAAAAGSAAYVVAAGFLPLPAAGPVHPLRYTVLATASLASSVATRHGRAPTAPGGPGGWPAVVGVECARTCRCGGDNSSNR